MPLETYVPEIRQFDVAGRVVAIAPLKVRQIPAFTRAISPVLGPLAAGDVLTAVAVGGEDLTRAVGIATGEDEAWLGELNADDFLLLAAAVIEVNADFFARRVLPALTAATERTQAILGAMPLPSSAATGTSTATA